MKKIALVFACLLTGGMAWAQSHWVGTWGTAPQLVENNNNPPSPGLGNNSLRQIVQVSIGGERVRLKLTNEFSAGATQIKAVELAQRARLCPTLWTSRLDHERMSPSPSIMVRHHRPV